ncbi:hypothetical protein pb186bvf_016994 [Paramecium bursaria]
MIQQYVSAHDQQSIEKINIVNIEIKSSFKQFNNQNLQQQPDHQLNQKDQEMNIDKIEALRSLKSAGNQLEQKYHGHQKTQQRESHHSIHQHSSFNICCDIDALYLDFLSIELCVGQIQEAWNHPFSEKLMCFTINVGQEIREIASGLRKFMPQDEFDGQCIVFKNLKPKNVLGFQSNGMMLTVANSDYTKVVLKKIQILNTWLKTQPHLNTDDNLKATFNGKNLITSQGQLSTQSLSNCSIS